MDEKRNEIIEIRKQVKFAQKIFMNKTFSMKFLVFTYFWIL